MTTLWDNFPVEQIGPATFLKRNAIHLELLRAALQRARGSLLEVGVGSGAQSSVLSRFVRRTVSLDNDLRILSAARPNTRRYGPSLKLLAADAFTMPFRDTTFGVAISQGLLEHFNDDEIGRLLREQLRVARSVVFSVPSNNYPRQDVGNERLLSPAHWQELVSGVVSDVDHVVRCRYYRLDLESWKYSLLAKRRLGPFSILVTIDPSGH